MNHALSLTLVAGFLLLVYGATLYPTHGGGLDSAEFQIAGKILGVTHPTGYPLYCLTGRLIASLPFSTLAVRVTLFSTLTMILALVLLLETARRITGSTWMAVFAVLLLAFSPPAWNTATIAEVYALHLLFVSTLFLFYLSYITEETTLNGIRLAFTLGLALTHHLAAIFILIGILLSEIPRRLGRTKQRISFSLFLRHGFIFLIPVTLLAYVPLRVANGAYSFDLYQFNSITDYVWYYLGGENPRLLNLNPVSFIQNQFFQGVVFFLEQWGVFPAVLTILGGVGLVHARHPLAPLLIWIFLAHIGLAGIWTVADRDAILLPSLLSAALFLAYGLEEIFRQVKKGALSSVAAYCVVAVLFITGAINARCAGSVILDRNQILDGAFLARVYEALPSKAVICTAFWERVNLFQYILHAGEFPDKEIHVYRWNDPRARAGLAEIQHYLAGTSSFGYDHLPPDPSRRFFFVDAPADLPPPGPFRFVPVQITETLSIFELRINPILSKPENPQSLPAAGLISQSADTWKVLTWAWHEPVANQTITGRPLMIQTRIYSTGIGAHAGSSLCFKVPLNAVRFEADVGPSGELPAGSPVSIVFQIKAEDRILVRSPVLRWDSPPYRLECPVQGESEIILEIDGTEDGLRADHAVVGEPVFWIEK